MCLTEVSALISFWQTISNMGYFHKIMDIYGALYYYEFAINLVLPLIYRASTIVGVKQDYQIQWDTRQEDTLLTQVSECHHQNNRSS